MIIIDLVQIIKKNRNHTKCFNRGFNAGDWLVNYLWLTRKQLVSHWQ